MKFSIEATGSGFLEVLGESVAARAHKAIASSELAHLTSLDENQVGMLLALSVSSNAEPIRAKLDDLVLSSVDLLYGEQRVSLSAADAFSHPLLGRWASANFEMALGETVKAGSQLTQLALGAPAFDELGLIEMDGAIIAGGSLLAFQHAGVWARLNYGDAAAFQSPSCTLHRYSGDAVVQLGVNLREKRAHSIADASGVA